MDIAYIAFLLSVKGKDEFVNQQTIKVAYFRELC
jgi:hypothetical protein